MPLIDTDDGDSAPCDIGCSLDLEQIVRLTTNAHVFFSTLQQMLGGKSYNASKDSPAQNPVVISNQIHSKYFKFEQFPTIPIHHLWRSTFQTISCITGSYLTFIQLLVYTDIFFFSELHIQTFPVRYLKSQNLLEQLSIFILIKMFCLTCSWVKIQKSLE